MILEFTMGRNKIRELLFVADVVTGDDRTLAAGVVVATTTFAIAATGGIIYLIRRRCRTRAISHPSDEQVG